MSASIQSKPPGHAFYLWPEKMSQFGLNSWKILDNVFRNYLQLPDKCRWYDVSTGNLRAFTTVLKSEDARIRLYALDKFFLIKRIGIQSYYCPNNGKDYSADYSASELAPRWGEAGEVSYAPTTFTLKSPDPAGPYLVFHQFQELPESRELVNLSVITRKSSAILSSNGLDWQEQMAKVNEAIERLSGEYTRYYECDVSCNPGNVESLLFAQEIKPNMDLLFLVEKGQWVIFPEGIGNDKIAFTDAGFPIYTVGLYSLVVVPRRDRNCSITVSKPSPVIAFVKNNHLVCLQPQKSSPLSIKLQFSFFWPKRNIPERGPLEEAIKEIIRAVFRDGCQAFDHRIEGEFGEAFHSVVKAGKCSYHLFFIADVLYVDLSAVACCPFTGVEFKYAHNSEIMLEKVLRAVKDAVIMKESAVSEPLVSPKPRRLVRGVCGYWPDLFLEDGVVRETDLFVDEVLKDFGSEKFVDYDVSLNQDRRAALFFPKGSSLFFFRVFTLGCDLLIIRDKGIFVFFEEGEASLIFNLKTGKEHRLLRFPALINPRKESNFVLQPEDREQIVFIHDGNVVMLTPKGEKGSQMLSFTIKFSWHKDFADTKSLEKRMTDLLKRQLLLEIGSSPLSRVDKDIGYDFYFCQGRPYVDGGFFAWNPLSRTRTDFEKPPVEDFEKELHALHYEAVDRRLRKLLASLEAPMLSLDDGTLKLSKKSIVTVNGLTDPPELELKFLIERICLLVIAAPAALKPFWVESRKLHSFLGATPLGYFEREVTLCGEEIIASGFGRLKVCKNEVFHLKELRFYYWENMPGFDHEEVDEMEGSIDWILQHESSLTVSEGGTSIVRFSGKEKSCSDVGDSDSSEDSCADIKEKHYYFFPESRTILVSCNAGEKKELCAYDPVTQKLYGIVNVGKAGKHAEEQFYLRTDNGYTLFREL